jgi:hypothetical protein
VEREEIERAVDSLLGLSRADEADREVIAQVLAQRVAAIRGDRDRALCAHSLVRLMLVGVPLLARVRHLAVLGLRAAGWSHGDVAGLLKVERSSAQTIARREGVRLPSEH